MFIDTHAHYDSEKFSSDRDALLAALPGEGIEAVIDPVSYTHLTLPTNSRV